MPVDFTKRQICVPFNAKIADITHADTNVHYLDLAVALAETKKIVSVKCGGARIAGTGNMKFFPNEGTYNQNMANSTTFTGDIVIANGTNRLQYSLSVANDDWDFYCYSYVVEA